MQSYTQKKKHFERAMITNASVGYVFPLYQVKNFFHDKKNKGTYRYL